MFEESLVVTLLKFYLRQHPHQHDLAQSAIVNSEVTHEFVVRLLLEFQ